MGMMRRRYTSQNRTILSQNEGARSERIGRERKTEYDQKVSKPWAGEKKEGIAKSQQPDFISGKPEVRSED